MILVILASVSRDICTDPHFTAANEVTIDDQTTTSFIKAVSLGALSPSASLRKTFQLSCIGSPGERQLDLSIRCQPSANEATTLPATEVLRTLTISAVRPLHCAFYTHFHERRVPVKPLLDLTEPDGWGGASEATVIVKLHAAGPWGIGVTGLRAHCEVSFSCWSIVRASADSCHHRRTRACGFFNPRSMGRAMNSPCVSREISSLFRLA